MVRPLLFDGEAVLLVGEPVGDGDEDDERSRSSKIPRRTNAFWRFFKFSTKASERVHDLRLRSRASRVP